MNKTEFMVFKVRNGTTNENIASALGISINTLYSKLNGTSEFTQSEIMKIKNFWGLNPDEVNLIFFSEE